MLHDYTVMVVDDDEDYLYITEIILQRAGIVNRIITASNGLKALEMLRGIAAAGGNNPTVIFLDLKMPVMDGFGFLEEATSSTELNLDQTRIYVTTSSVLPKDKEKALAYPIAGFIPKPLNQNILREILI